MKHNALPEIPQSALRDYGKGRHIERVWRRLESELGPAQAQRRSALWWAPALAVVTFGAGLFVGARFLREEVQAPVAAEPPAVAAPGPRPASAPAAVSQKREVPNKVARPRHHQPSSPDAELVPSEDAPLALIEEPREYEPLAPVASLPDWERHAELGDFAAARSALDAAGGFDAVFLSAKPARLMTLFDVARASGNRDQALRALRRLLEAYPGAAEAPDAAWTLGNMLDQAGDKAGATEAYALYRRLSPAGDFAEDAAAREVDIALSQGTVERAAVLVDEYARTFPKSWRLAKFRADLRKLSGVSAPESAEKSETAEADGEAGELEESASAPAP